MDPRVLTHRFSSPLLLTTVRSPTVPHTELLGSPPVEVLDRDGSYMMTDVIYESRVEEERAKRSLTYSPQGGSFPGSASCPFQFTSGTKIEGEQEGG